MTWTVFWDMHSGGDPKEKFDKICIEAPRKEAIVIFFNKFGHNPDRVTCTCCGADYSIGEYPDFETTERNVKEYSTRILYITAENIQPEDRQGDVPEQGYVWIENLMTVYILRGPCDAHTILGVYQNRQFASLAATIWLKEQNNVVDVQEVVIWSDLNDEQTVWSLRIWISETEEQFWVEKKLVNVPIPKDIF